MKKLFRYSQQLIVVLVVASASVGIVFAADFDVSTLVSGFLRRVNNGHDDPLTTHPGQVFYYGYGFSGNLQGWGYGYGYDEYYGLSNSIPPTLTAEYGFEGTEGPVTVENVVVDKTTATITYSTNYLAKITRGYSLDNINPIVLESESLFNSGQRTWEITGLDCGTQYHFGFSATDAGQNYWLIQDLFTTFSCSSSHGTQVVGGNVNNPATVPSSVSSKLRLPPITLALGSIGVDVQDLQKLLNYFGTFLASHGAGSPGEETQYFGQKTYAAVKAFQQVFDLKKVDGIYGVETQVAMSKFLQ